MYIGVPTENERKQILQVLVSPLLIQEKAELCCKVARLTPGYVGADLSLLCQDVILGRYRRKVCMRILNIPCVQKTFDLVPKY